MLVADKRLLSIVSPLNFAFQNVYTLTHLLHFPLLALTAGSSQLKQLGHPTHVIEHLVNDTVEFELQRLTVNYQHLCFVNYPYDLQNNSLEDFE